MIHRPDWRDLAPRTPLTEAEKLDPRRLKQIDEMLMKKEFWDLFRERMTVAETPNAS